MLSPSNSETGQLQLPYFKDFCVQGHQLTLLIFPASCMQDLTPSLAHTYISLSLSPRSSVIDLAVRPQAANTQLSVKNTQQPKGNNWRTNGWTQLLVPAPNIWRLVYCWTTAESVPELCTDWEVHENRFSYQSCRTFVLQSQQKEKVGKNIFIILGLYSLARRKWENTER